jgi:hypothetical protein
MEAVGYLDIRPRRGISWDVWRYPEDRILCAIIQAIEAFISQKILELGQSSIGFSWVSLVVRGREIGAMGVSAMRLRPLDCVSLTFSPLLC